VVGEPISVQPGSDIQILKEEARTQIERILLQGAANS
jgi:hypothetical protein